ncbi:unsaturated rhamnogalacturonyl hydrolase [Paenibacillus sp. UNCCL117]|uniref:beta-galactosidase BglB n=1 Tax=unclassified Paenibacillus TaxID=185978 RepID=UPI000885D794|nr:MULTISPECIES: glycoside hydrolase family 88 protein [unclassified Paenibacillus]SDC28275.1 unsaturated rhamnogalacturonyl hydrolase [Paenibacillus sp. cl123]SFW20515.1 unsaturated rhamnogalacturonyl hydrolase [Paenibacillus sp. UNCCL117]
MPPLSKSVLKEAMTRVIRGMHRLEISVNEDTPASIISMDVWDWSQGVGLFSLYRYYEETGDSNMLFYLNDWFRTRVQEGLPERNINTMCPLLTLSFLYERTGDEEALRLCSEWVDYAVRKLPRTPEGGIAHTAADSPNEGELWDDTLYMTVLLIGRMGMLLKRDDYVQESIRQFLVHLKYLTDVRTGLFFHGWSFKERHHFAHALWGRGNAWYTAGLVDYLDMVQLPEGVRQFLLTSLGRQIDALAELQAESGLWHTLLDDPSSYEETSASAGFAYGILKAVRMGYTDPSRRDIGLRALEAVIGQIDDGGAVHGVSYGTRMGRTQQFYKDIPQCPMPYGQSMTLLLLVESLMHAD